MEQSDINITRNLSDLLDQCRQSAELYSSGDLKEVKVVAVEYDSRKVTEGAVFVAVEGYETDGHGFIDAAIAKGAAAVVVSRKRAGEFLHLDRKSITLLVSDNTRKALSCLSASFYDNPSRKMKVIGITGTNGKTSITYMIESVLKENGLETGVMGTINYRWGGVERPAPNTTPESRDMQEMFYRMHRDGVRAVVMEISSHALELNRADDIDLDAAVFTNLTRDHLDFHHDFEAYFSAKKRIFSILDRSIKEKKIGIVNGDDEYGARILKNRNNYSYPIVSFGVDSDAYFRTDRKSIVNEISGLSYVLESPEKGLSVSLQLAGTFHVYNSLAALATLVSLDVPYAVIQQGLKKLKSVPGRFDTITTGLGFGVVVDYAHTSDALQKLLDSVNELKKNRIITVFGCGGDRDRTKRPIMGKIAVDFSDHVIITSDNPRTEEPDAIIRDITAGIEKINYDVESDREKAIAMAVAMGEPGDIIVIAGKGHEDYQILGRSKIHFDDHEIASKYIREREKV
ncbi:MAG: UDP-N-acetylmuramoyl-L-alanyl-D-glutamate--2,6-diaminopimelate ligase [Spirochaetae bacterium HGW-Spirochaetae-1]|jgi:UDP-N-acetylmuramoyl-L-alanyl-D-glutamate--2,6-diaminopimelate ligase|nr:MAG: UDP-N-acetylmuramoyl-L-alanyl-D-glutamate--2,6-diaminopimelate ligase [Spirochaetae bacterium HGW-Spirochaetae-1]